MKSLNKVQLIGNLGADPELRYSPSGVAFASVNVATSSTSKKRDTGETREFTEWHKLVFSGSLAEVVGKYLKKGSKIYVEGRLQTRKWQGKDGQDRYTTEIRSNTMIMLDGRGGGGGQQSGQPAAPQSQQPQQPSQPQRPSQPQQPAASAPAQSQNGDDFFDDDDIPF